MNPKFHEAMQRIGRLTQAGRLGDATAAIQDALSAPVAAAQGARHQRTHADVIDIEARVLPDQPAGQAPPQAPETEQQAVPKGEPGSFTSGHYSNHAGQRSYKLYRPTQPAPQGQRPALVVMLHGCTQNPDDFATGTGMNDCANRRGWWVLYPAQAAADNPSGCWNWFKPGDQQSEVGEPAILAGMISSVARQAGIDPGRVVVAGLSAGAAMALTLAATHPHLMAALGVHSGLPHACAHDLVSAMTAMRKGHRHAHVKAMAPVPVIVFHGDADKTVHPDNALAVLAQARAAPVDTLGAAGQVHLGSDPGPTETEHAGRPGAHRYTRHIYRDARHRATAELWIVHGAAHAWSGGRPAGSFTDPRGPDASAEMLRFFAEQLGD